MELTHESAAQAVVGDILTSRGLLKSYRRNPDKTIDESLGRLGVTDKTLLADARATARRRMEEETDKVFPGLSREEAKNMLLGSLGVPERSYAIFTLLNGILFAVGLALLVAAAVIGFVKEKEQFTVMFGTGGFGIIVYMFVTNPLKRIANAASDQSQIRTVVFGFWVQLANWRTDLLGPADSLDYETLRRVNSEIQKSMEHGVKTLQRYAENKEFSLPQMQEPNRTGGGTSGG